MRPMEIMVLMDLYFHDDVHKNIVNSQGSWDAIYALEDKEMVRRNDDWGNCTITDKGKCFIEAIAQIKEPVLHTTWRVPV